MNIINDIITILYGSYNGGGYMFIGDPETTTTALEIVTSLC